MKIRLVSAALLLCLTGCASTPTWNNTSVGPGLRDQAFECLKRGTLYEALPSVRAQAVESLQHAAPDKGLPWIRMALRDPHPGVRFAGLMAVGLLRDAGSREAIEQGMKDESRSVQVASIAALHRLGTTLYTHRLPEFLFSGSEPDPSVRANAAMVLGRLGESGAVKLLARVMSEENDEAVRLQALESLSLLGNPEAVEQLSILAHTAGDRGAFAVNALGELEKPRYTEVFRHSLHNGQHLETRLIAARALGRIGLHDGYQTGLEGIRFDQPTNTSEDDPAWVQVVRVQQLAALALGAIGDPAALSDLEQKMLGDYDPRIRIAAARAILEIMGGRDPGKASFH